MVIGCIIVLYNPQLGLITQSINQLTSQIDVLVLVDNSCSYNKDIQKLEVGGKIKYIHLGENRGIAVAQNIGVKMLKHLAVEVVLFMDQDSIAPNNMVEMMKNEIYLLSSLNVRLGGIGPCLLNRQNNVKYRKGSQKEAIFDDQLSEVKELMSSGSFIPISNFDIVGLFEEAFFIDGVDNEWCWRAGYKGFRFFRMESLIIEHQLGEGDRTIFNRDIAISTPFRTYYQFRNFIFLLVRGYVPMRWKVYNAFKYIVKLFYYPLFVSPRLKYLQSMLRGISDGILELLKK